MISSVEHITVCLFRRQPPFFVTIRSPLHFSTFRLSHPCSPTFLFQILLWRFLALIHCTMSHTSNYPTLLSIDFLAVVQFHDAPREPIYTTFQWHHDGKYPVEGKNISSPRPATLHLWNHADSDYMTIKALFILCCWNQLPFCILCAAIVSSTRRLFNHTRQQAR